ncbi:hypothetical protein KBY23_13345 [Ruegeria pomeroyi]|nr:hypothetical protein [Ruegeria pomeroyi]
MRFDAYFPSSNSISDLCKFSKELMEEEEKAKFHISAKRLGFVTPTTMIFLAKTCRQRARKFKDEQRVYHGLSALSYANNLGFSDALSLQGRPFRQGAFGGKSYIPITNIIRRRLEESAAENGTQIGDEIEARCGTLADVVSQGRTRYLKKLCKDHFVK